MMELTRLMDAYRGNEDKLRQRVALSNDLLELIAYEQLTREKKRLMADQQAKAGMPTQMPTVRDQKEQEAFELTKQELSQQIGETLQQREAQRKQAMMRGLAAAPGADNVMSPQAMAAGGIVAFQSRGYVEEPERIPYRDRQTARQSVYASRRKLQPEPVGEEEFMREAPREAPNVGFEVPGSSTGTQTSLRAEPRAPEVEPEKESDVPKTDSRVSEGIVSALSAGRPSDNVQAELKNQLQTSLTAARNRAGSPLVDQLSGLTQEVVQHAANVPKTPEDIKKARLADLSRLEQRYEQMMDPEAQRIKALSAFFGGGAGRRGIGSVLSGAGSAAAQSQAQQEAQGLQALKDMQTAREASRKQSMEDAMSAYAAQGQSIASRTNILNAAAQIKAQLDIQDSRAAASIADAAIRAYASYSGDIAKVQAEIAKAAAEYGYKLNKDDLDRATNVTVANITAGGKQEASLRTQIRSLTNTLSTAQDRMLSEQNDELRDNPMLKMARNVEPSKRSPAQQRLVEEFDRKYAARRAEINTIRQQIDSLQQQLGQAPLPPVQEPRSAADQGVKVTGAAAPRER